MIVLDTNVVSELMRREPAAAVIAWVDQQPPEEVWLTAVTLAELLYGIGRLPDGQRKTSLAAALETMLEEDLDHRVAAFDETAAVHFADIVVVRERAGTPISAADAQIAAICRSYGATVATRNVDDFEGTGIAVIDPWSGSRLR